MDKDDKDCAKGSEPKMDTTIVNDKRSGTPSQSIIQSFKEIKLMKEGKLPKKSWWDYIKEQKEKG